MRFALHGVLVVQNSHVTATHTKSDLVGSGRSGVDHLRSALDIRHEARLKISIKHSTQKYLLLGDQTRFERTNTSRLSAPKAKSAG